MRFRTSSVNLAPARARWYLPKCLLLSHDAARSNRLRDIESAPDAIVTSRVEAFGGTCAPLHKPKRPWRQIPFANNESVEKGVMNLEASHSRCCLVSNSAVQAVCDYAVAFVCLTLLLPSALVRNLPRTFVRSLSRVFEVKKPTSFWNATKCVSF